MSVFFQQLEARITSTDSLLCIGLDPHSSQLPTPTPEAAIKFCVDIIRETHPYAACFKPNSAFFEALGAEGMSALQTVLAAIPLGIPVILDVKRGDIDTTAQAYAEAALGVLGVGSVTLSPYMGTDSIRPFVTNKFKDRAAFILCKTSNPSSKVQCIRRFV
jgi:orotidine 5'-phosphate decarboxylase subfamily 2